MTATGQALKEIADYQMLYGKRPAALVVSAEFLARLWEEWQRFQTFVGPPPPQEMSIGTVAFFDNIPVRTDAHPIADCLARSS